MASVHREHVGIVKKQGVKMALNMGTFEELVKPSMNGRFFFDMRDAKTGEQLAYFEKDNVLTLDCSILAARLFRNSLDPVAGTSTTKGITHLDIGTGATGNILSPDAPQPEQRKLNTRICRKAVTTQFRNDSGVAVSYPTHIVDFTTTYSESEAVGPLNEMGLVSAYNAAGYNDINNGAGTPDPYDATLQVLAKDLLANYLTFGVIVKPATAILTITWRLSF